MSQLVPDFVREALERDELLLFVGSGISRSTTQQRGLATASELGRMISSELLGEAVVPGEVPDLARLSQRAVWKDQGSRFRLQKLLRREFAQTVTPLASHLAIAILGVPVVTTNYDNLIEQAYAALGTDAIAIWSDRHLPTVTTNLILKVHGTIDEPESCVITEDDYHDWLSRDSDLRSLTRAMLLTRTVCFVGYSLSDPNFRTLVRDIRRKFGPMRRPSLLISHAIDEGSYDFQFVTKSLGVTVVESDATEFLESLVDASQRSGYAFGRSTSKLARTGPSWSSAPRLSSTGSSATRRPVSPSALQPSPLFGASPLEANLRTCRVLKKVSATSPRGHSSPAENATETNCSESSTLSNLPGSRWRLLRTQSTQNTSTSCRRSSPIATAIQMSLRTKTTHPVLMLPRPRPTSIGAPRSTPTAQLCSSTGGTRLRSRGGGGRGSRQVLNGSVRREVVLAVSILGVTASRRTSPILRSQGSVTLWTCGSSPRETAR
jgi:hypothetical protein